MHTAKELDSADFEYRAGGKSVSRRDVMPAISPSDRVGVVMGAGTEGIDAGNFVLSCVTAFYDHLRERKETFFEYPDFYTFQTTSDPADYRMLDVYPQHKNVTVEPDAERLVQSIADRAIDVLLVPNHRLQESDIEEIGRRSVERHVTGCYLYAGENQLDEADFSIGLPRQPANDWYETTIDSVEHPSATDRQTTIESSGPPLTQRFRRIDLETALAHLPVCEEV